MESSLSKKALKQFNKLGFTEDSLLCKEELSLALDFICEHNTGTPYFSQKLKSKLWHQCPKSKNCSASLKSFLQQLENETVNLGNLIVNIEQKLCLDQVALPQKIQLKKMLIQYKNQARFLTQTFKINQPPHQQNRQKENYNPEQEESQKPDHIREAEKGELEELKKKEGDLFLQVFLREKGASTKAIETLRKNNIHSFINLKELTLEDLCLLGLSLSDSIIFKKL